MKREKLTNREFDELAKRLFNSAKPNEKEIETIASNPQLFEGVMSKIAAESRPSRPPFAWKPVLSASLAGLIVCFSILAYFLAPEPTKIAVNPVTPAPVQSSQPDFVYTPKQLEPSPAATDPRESADVRPPKGEYAVMSKPADVPEPRKPRSARVKPVKQPEPAFYPIGLREKAEDAAIDGRVVRVEMPRAALFALGVDVPLENGARSIKADLLLGADGSPRAIRLVE